MISMYLQFKFVQTNHTLTCETKTKFLFHCNVVCEHLWAQWVGVWLCVSTQNIFVGKREKINLGRHRLKFSLDCATIALNRCRRLRHRRVRIMVLQEFTLPEIDDCSLVASRFTNTMATLKSFVFCSDALAIFYLIHCGDAHITYIVWYGFFFFLLSFLISGCMFSIYLIHVCLYILI